MKYASEQEKKFIDDAIANSTYRIDYAYQHIYSLYEGAYLFESSFRNVGAAVKNTERFIIRAIYRAK